MVDSNAAQFKIRHFMFEFTFECSKPSHKRCKGQLLREDVDW